LRLVARNWRCPAGEIDLVMQDGDTLVFIEVRYRGSERFGGAVATVDARKQARVVRAARHYLQGRGELAVPAARFDVVGVAGGRGAQRRIEWIRDAFRTNW